MSQKFECSICCEEYPFPKPNTRITRRTVSPCVCPSCNYLACSKCQTQYAKGDCSNCHYEFSSSFINETLGSTFYKDIVIPRIKQDLMKEQRLNLQTVDVQAHVEWLNKCAAIRSASRFGHSERLPRKPGMTGHTFSSNTKYLCPLGDCRGIVLDGVCSVCRGKFCALCHETKENDEHVCNADAKLVVAQSKACPKCFSMIFKTEGCDHMHCTACDTRFSWNTLEVQTRNTNHHYANGLFHYRNPHAPSSAADSNSAAVEDFCHVSNRLDRIPRDTMERIIADNGGSSVVPTDLFRWLYDVPTAVRSAKVLHFDEPKLATDLHNSYHELRVQFLIKKVSESTWTQRVFSLHMDYKAHMFHADIINIYLATTDNLQAQLRDAVQQQPPSTPEVYDGIRDQYMRLTDLCNRSFVDIHRDYPIDATPYYIRNVGDDENSAVLDDFGCLYQQIVVATGPRKCRSEEGNGEETKEDNDETKEIQLYEYQKEQITKLSDILSRCHFALDLSMLGSGKTYTALYLYKHYGYAHGIVIAQTTVAQKWRELIAAFGLEGIDVYTFSECSLSKGSAASVSSKNRMRNLLRRRDTMTTQGTTITFHPTPLLLQYIRQGMFVVIDEIQNIKNKGTAQTGACKAIVCAVSTEYRVTQGATKSRALLISGSPIDKEVQVAQFFQTVGVMTHFEFQRFNIGELARQRREQRLLGDDTVISANDGVGHIETGLADIAEFCRRFDPASVDSIAEEYYNRYDKTAPLKKCFRYFMEIVKPHLSATMLVRNKHKISKFNGFFELDASRQQRPSATAADEDEEEAEKKQERHQADFIERLMTHGLQLLCRGLTEMEQQRGGGQRPQGETSGQTFALLQKGRLFCETAKIPLMVKLVRTHLRKRGSTCKVVLTCNFTQTIEDLKRELTEFNPLILQGDVVAKKRSEVLRKFQEPSLNNRLLIGNLHAISTGIDLDDKDGGFPRICYVNPNYNTIDLYQMSYRFLRALDTKSDSEMHMLYIKGCKEKSIMEALATKGKVMKEVTQEQSDIAGVIFPCDFTDYEYHIPHDQLATWNSDCQEIILRCANGVEFVSL